MKYFRYSTNHYHWALNEFSLMTTHTRLQRLFQLPKATLSLVRTASVAAVMATAAPAALAEEKPQVFVSDVSPPMIVELFTSEGCSSCPPADRFLSGLQKSDDLWSKVIPMAFHVDYWDYLGWEDEYANSANSKRQRRYHQQGNTGGVYTPGFVVNGQEWRGFFRLSKELPEPSKAPVGRLILTSSGSDLSLEFKPEGSSDMTETKYEAYVAYLATDVKSKIKQGENRGKTLEHDFVVIKKSALGKDNHQWQARSKSPEAATAVVAWIESPGNQAPVQAVGGWLN